MEKKKLFTHNDIMLNDSLPRLSINSLKQIFPNNFPRRDSLISFYSTYNGGYFDGGAYIYREDIYTLKPDDYNLLEIEAFNFIPAHPNQTHSKLISTTEKLDLRIIHHKANSCFLSKTSLSRVTLATTTSGLTQQPELLDTRDQSTYPIPRAQYLSLPIFALSSTP
ncbi:hypothetical protein KI429_04780 [Pseudomonas shirazica]|nr:hypothetical protein KI429_04780 [Pseudomonas shirazica]